MRRRFLFAALGSWVLAGTLGVVPSAAYYHYLHYTARFGAIQEKFDLSVLPGKIVTFFVSDAGAGLTQYAGNDSFSSVLSQIRQATLAWNGVTTSDLRVAYGGLTTVGTPQSAPGGLVTFEDMPPGVLAFTTRTTGDATSTATGAFVPLLQTTVHVNRNLTVDPGPSYLESFYTTMVHEMGHALGLQHTFTASAMSTSVTRSTTRSRPLDADDVAGISLLYPSSTFAGSFGSIAGRVTSGGQAIHMASVVAIRPNGSAVSTLTALDGTYRIEGLPADKYWVYVHPLPPTADIQVPLDDNNAAVAASGPIETLFYPGTRDPSQFALITVDTKNPVQGINFQVQKRSAVPVYDVATFKYVSATRKYISPASLNFSSSDPYDTVLVARGTGLLPGNAPIAGLGIQVLGGYTSTGMAAFTDDSGASLAVFLPPLPGTGPRHLFFLWPQDAYVLPSAINVVQKAPPSIAVAPGIVDGTVAVTGSNLNSGTRIFFDGNPAAVTVPFSGSDQSGAIVVTPPQGAGNQVATVTAFNPDGQNSMFLESQNPPVYGYGPSLQPIVTGVNPVSLPAGASAMVDITVSGTRFVDGQVSLGFGTNDITVRRLWVAGPTHLIADVTVAGNAQLSNPQVSVTSGFQIFGQPFGFQIQPANPRLPSITLPVVNANPAQATVYPGAAATINGTNLALTASSAVVTLNDQPAQVVAASAGQVTFIVPAGLGSGPAVLKLFNGSDNAYPVAIQIDPAPPLVTGVLTAANAPADGMHPVAAGDLLLVGVTGLDGSAAATPSRVRVSFGAVGATPLAVQPQGSGFQVVVLVPSGVAGPFAPVTVSVDGGPASAPFFIAVK